MKNILFDLDGTLTDSKPGIVDSLEYALDKMNIKLQDKSVLSKFIGPPLKFSFNEYIGLEGDDINKAIDYYREYFAQKGIYGNKLYDGMEDMLKNLKALGKNLIVATSKPTVFATKIIENFNVTGYFSYISGADLSESHADKSGIILHALKECKVTNLDDAIMVGDRRYDIHGAKTVGIKSIGVLYGYGDLEELTAEKADYIAKDVKDVQRIIESL